MDSDPRRTYLAKHGVEAAVTAAITKVLEKQPTDPVSEVGRCLLDSKYAVPAGVTVLPVLQYVTNFGVKAAVSDAIKAIASAMPKDPIKTLGAKLAGGVEAQSEFMAYWAPRTFAASALPTVNAFEDSLKLPTGARMMVEREARGYLMADIPKSEFMSYWNPASFPDSALENKKAFEDSLKLPAGKRMMIERAARGYLPVDQISEAPKRSEFEEFWAPRTFEKSALRTPKLFFQSLSMPMGARMAMERAARKIEDPSEFPRSEYETYWAPWDAKKSALSPEDYKKTLNMPAGKRMMIEREMRGIIDADMPRSEFMEYWAPRTFEASSIQTKAEYDKVAKGPYGKLMEAERKALGYLEVSTISESPKRSEYEAYWAPTTFEKSAIKDKDAFFKSLSMASGERAVLERAARGMVMVA